MRPRHPLESPTNSPVGIFLPIAACSRASARSAADFGFVRRPPYRTLSALSGPLFSPPCPRHRGRSPQARNFISFLFHGLYADLLTRFYPSIGHQLGFFACSPRENRNDVASVASAAAHFPARSPQSPLSVISRDASARDATACIFNDLQAVGSISNLVGRWGMRTGRLKKPTEGGGDSVSAYR